jgi:uncharacterized cupin superfamily protein
MPPTLIRVDDESAFSQPLAVAMPMSETIATVRLAADQPIPVGTTGIWECTPGRFRRQVSQAEYSCFITGRGTFTADGCEPVTFRAGDAIYFPANSEGEWNIIETVRKAYVIFS